MQGSSLLGLLVVWEGLAGVEGWGYVCMGLNDSCCVGAEMAVRVGLRGLASWVSGPSVGRDSCASRAPSWLSDVGDLAMQVSISPWCRGADVALCAGIPCWWGSRLMV